MKTIEALLTEAYTHWNDPGVLDRTGRELHDRNRLDAARDVLERAVELMPGRDDDTWGHLAFSYMRGFQHQEGLEALRRGITATNSDDLRSILSAYTDDEEEERRLAGDIADCDLPSVKARVVSKSFYEGEEHHQSALAAIRELQRAHPDDEAVAHTLCWIFMNGRGMDVVDEAAVREEALPVLDALIAKEPEKVWSRTMKVMMLAGLEDWDGVIEEADGTLAIFPDEETHMQFRGRAFREKGDHVRAVQALSRAIGMKTSFAGARVDLGKTYEDMDRLDLAEEIFREIPAANPTYAGGPVSLALFLGRQERWDEAESIFLEAWPKLPDWMKKVMPGNPAAKSLLERPAVKAVLEAD